MVKKKTLYVSISLCVWYNYSFKNVWPCRKKCRRILILQEFYGVVVNRGGKAKLKRKRKKKIWGIKQKEEKKGL